MSNRLSFAPGWLALFLSNCATVPPLYEDEIGIAEIVQRVKCELAYAMPVPQPPIPTGPYQWTSDWTAKIDLTLTVNENAAVTPTATFIHPLLTQTVPGVGNVMRSFTFGFGAGLNTTAVREETMSFTLSMAELRNQYYLGVCQQPKDLGLLGNLGLREWIRSAFAPVDAGELWIGNHAPPASKTTPAAGAKATSVQTNPDKKNADEMVFASIDAVTEARNATAAANSAKILAKKALAIEYRSPPAVFTRAMQTVYDAAGTANGDAAAANKDANRTNTLADELTARIAVLKQQDSSGTNREIQDVISYVEPKLKPARDQAKSANTEAASATKAANAATQSLPHDPPIDAIGHQVQFIVALSGNTTPNWTLVNWKGPGASSTLASASNTITHTLNIGLGSPKPPSAAKTVGAETLRQLDTLHLDSAIRQIAPGM